MFKLLFIYFSLIKYYALLPIRNQKHFWNMLLKIPEFSTNGDDPSQGLYLKRTLKTDKRPISIHVSAWICIRGSIASVGG
jgi:hypothetical protein